VHPVSVTTPSNSSSAMRVWIDFILFSLVDDDLVKLHTQGAEARRR
jgi:hypothetical protein